MYNNEVINKEQKGTITENKKMKKINLHLEMLLLRTFVILCLYLNIKVYAQDVDIYQNMASGNPGDGYSQVGKNVVAASVRGLTIRSSANFGRCSSHGNIPDNKTSTYLDHIMIDYTNAAFPLLPEIDIKGSIYWVSPQGQASWQDSKSPTPLNGRNACTLATANANASAGDTVYLREGKYHNIGFIQPTNSGAENARITFSNYDNENVTITDVDYGILIDGKSYITISGLNFDYLGHFLFITNNANYNVVQYCTFNEARNINEYQGGKIYYSSKYNHVHHCSFSRWGCFNGTSHFGAMLDIGRTSVSTDESYFNIIENNTFFYGGHNLLSVFSRYNVIRNNYMHNEGWYRDTTGYRCAITCGMAAELNLFEGNVFSFAGKASGMSLRSARNIFRRNIFYNNGHGGIQCATDDYMNHTKADSNHIYHNIFFNNGHKAKTIKFSGGIYFADWGRGDPVGNVVKNNIFGRNAGGMVTYSDVSTPQVIENNWDNEDPLFVYDGSPLDPFWGKPDFHLQESSPCIDRGGFLTTITSKDGSGTEFTVNDAGYFMDGWGIIQGDLIQLEDPTQRVKITNVNYVTNTMTVETSVTWKNGTGVSLPFVGLSPDMGAYEYTHSPTSTRIKLLK